MAACEKPVVAEVRSERQDMGAVLSRDQRADFGFGVHRVADTDLGDTGEEALDESVGNAALEQDAGAGEALLAVVGEDAEQRPIECPVEIGGFEHDVG